MGIKNNLTRMEEEIGEQIRSLRPAEPVPIPLEVQKYAPPSLRHDTPLHLIASAVCALTWHDAEQMGAGIQQKLSTDNKDITDAIQSWAEEYARGDQ
jgi:hypothetical protein